MRALGIRAKLAVSQPSDPEEHEADRMADAFVGGRPAPPAQAPARPGVLQRACASCEEEPRTVHRKTGEAGAPSPTVSGLGRRLSSGPPGSVLAPSIRRPYERFFAADLSTVRVHDDRHAHETASALNARAFAYGAQIYFARGQFDAHTTEGRRLLAHELAHVAQPASGLVRRQPAPAAGTLPAESEAAVAGGTVTTAVRNGDVPAAVAPLRRRSVEELKTIIGVVQRDAKVDLGRWLAGRLGRAQSIQTAGKVSSLLNVVVPGASIAGQIASASAKGTAASAEEGLRLVWPALGLASRLLVYDEGFREIEQAQLDVIRSYPFPKDEDRAAILANPDVDRVLKNMDAKEEYDGRVLIDGSPAGLLAAAKRAVERGDKDPVFDAVLALAPKPREEFVRTHEVQLYRMLSNYELDLVRSMARQVKIDGQTFGGNEVDALIARLRLATEGRRDDMVAVQAVIDRAVALLKERRTLQAELASPSLPADQRKEKEQRLTELKDLDRLFSLPAQEDGRFADNSFMRLIAEARDNPDAFGADAARFAEFAPTPEAARAFAFQTAKQRILDAGADLEGIRSVLISTKAPPVKPASGASPDDTAKAQQKADEELRRDLMKDGEIVAITRRLTTSERRHLETAVAAGPFEALMYQIAQANRNARWGELFRLILRVAKSEAFRAGYNERRGKNFDVHANIRGEQREIVEAILETRRLPLDRILKFTGDVDLLRTALADMPEQQRSRLRLGWALSRQLVSGELNDDQKKALEEYRTFEAQVRASQTTVKLFDAAGFEAVLGAALGSEPTMEEMSTGEGRYRAAALMYERHERREALSRGASAHFTESDETMVAAAREFAALWLPMRDRTPRQITMVELATLSALHQRFLNRSQEFTDASNTVGEMAGMIAATVAGLVVVVATGGAATPAVIALAAASGAGARVVTREMFGADYYNAMSDQAARDALLGAIDGALAVVSGRLALKGAELVGMSGKALTSGAARAAGVVAEEATQPFARRVAAGAVESAIDGLFSGAASEAFGAMTDDATWRRGVMDGLVRVGQAAIVGGLVGLGTGGVVGAAAPVVGRGASHLWKAVVGQSIDNAATKAGVHAELAAARKAAGEGRVADANLLMSKVEPHLSPEQVLALRDEINTQLRQKLGRPPGTAEAQSPRQAELLRASGARDGGLTPEHLDAEWDVIRRSQPQPSSTAGYVDEVDLGNGHTWKRQADGTWCRFSKPSMCSVIPNAPKLDATARAKAEAAYGELMRLQGDIAAARDIANEWPAIADKLARESRPGPGGLKLDVLTKHEREVLEQVFANTEKLESLTLADITRARGRPGAEFAKLLEQQDAAIARLRDSTQPLYDKVRAASPRERVRQDVISSAKGVDQISGLPPPSKQLQADHVVPVREIVDMPGFSRLDWEDQVAVANHRRNFRAVDARVNASRGDRSWAEQFPQRGTYTPAALAAAAQLEAQLRVELQAEINRRLLAAGRKVGP